MNRTVVATLTLFLIAAADASARQAAALDAAFQLYCNAGDSSTWFCAERPVTLPPLTDAQKWDILVGYCLDDEAYTASRSRSDSSPSESPLPRSPGPPATHSRLCPNR